MDPKTIVGLDISLTDTGLSVIRDHGTYDWRVEFVLSIKTTPKDSEQFRRAYIVNSILEHVLRHAPDRNTSAVIIEGYAMGRNTGKLFTRAEIIGTVKYMLGCMGYTVFVAAPTAIKKFMGDGRNQKLDMKHAAKTNFGFIHGNHNVIDAFCACRYLVANRAGMRLPLDMWPPTGRPEFLYAPTTKKVRILPKPPLTKKLQRPIVHLAKR